MLIARSIENKFLPRPSTSLPTPQQLSQMQENFVNDREAIRLTRNPAVDLERASIEVQEAHQEIPESLFRRLSSEKLAEETGDVFIYLLSVTAAMGLNPEEIGNALKQRQESSPNLISPLRRSTKRTFLRNELNNLEGKITYAQNHLEETQNSLECQCCRHMATLEKVLDSLHHAWQVGKAVDKRFEYIVAAKIKKNTIRFKPEEFRVNEGENPEVVYTVAYLRQKVREERLSPAEAHNKAQNTHNILINPAVFSIL